MGRQAAWTKAGKGSCVGSQTQEETNEAGAWVAGGPGGSPLRVHARGRAGGASKNRCGAGLCGRSRCSSRCSVKQGGGHPRSPAVRDYSPQKGLTQHAPCADSCLAKARVRPSAVPYSFPHIQPRPPSGTRLVLVRFGGEGGGQGMKASCHPAWGQAYGGDISWATPSWSFMCLSEIN